MERLTQKLLNMFNSNVFFYTILSVFGVSVAWVSFASIYPMAFDEEFHYGLIKIYATAWLPYGIEHTRDMAQYGSATGDPSYLFHYLMSFPYRLIAATGMNDAGIILALRLINLGFVIGALLLFARTLREAGMKQVVINITMALLCVIPVFVMLAAQINYDNLLLLIVGLSSLLTVRLTNGVLQNHRIRTGTLWMLMAVLLVGMSIKYAFLPIVAGMGLWLIGLAVYHWRQNHRALRSQVTQLIKDSAHLSIRYKLIIIASLILGMFFAAHYVTNTVQYGHPIPDCSAVFDEQACTAYGPWNRNRNYVNNLSDSFQPLSYPAYMVTEWFPGMGERLTFALAGKTNGFQTKQPLPLTLIGLVVLTVIGFACLLFQIVRRPKNVSSFTWLSILLMTVYVAVLSAQLYGEYVRTGQPVAINGRYLLLLLPLFGAVLIDETVRTIRRIPNTYSVMLLGLVLMLFIVGGGGVATYIIQAESHWLYEGLGQQSHAVLQAIFESFTIRWQLFP